MTFRQELNIRKKELVFKELAYRGVSKDTWGTPLQELADRFGISKGTLWRWQKEWEKGVS